LSFHTLPFMLLSFAVASSFKHISNFSTISFIIIVKKAVYRVDFATYTKSYLK
jgi:hypothetical protein